MFFIAVLDYIVNIKQKNVAKFPDGISLVSGEKFSDKGLIIKHQ